MNLRRVTLEVSLKPFWDVRPEAIEQVCIEMYRQWDALTRHADEIGVMMWSADGSELLDYAGDLNADFEWAKYIGIANMHGNISNDPEGISTHSKRYLYRENIPERYTYRDLALVVKMLRKVGEKMTGKKVFIGTTFDPGGEFAESSFKYKRHPEICMANTMGAATFVTCYATLKGDTHHYAGFPDGIPDGTSLGLFLGRQTKHFVRDLGFDFLWLSNGFGFGLETWKPTGPLFDGEHFDAVSAPGIREKNLHFWRDFRKELPDVPIEVRGTNLGTGADLATDAVPLREIYNGGFNIVTPPNSPWAALNGDFGIELGGYLSRIVELPTGSHVPFRFYTHDPWWLNSPWLDRYQREPHDIYLPLSVSRIDSSGCIESASTLNLLTVDDSYGRMPVEVPNESTPHLLAAFDHAPDEPGLITWIYPFDEFHDHTAQDPKRLNEAFFHDWFIRCGINTGLPVNTVVSTKNFVGTYEKSPATYAHTVLLSLIPDAGSKTETALIKHVTNGGKVLLFGPLDHASTTLKQMLNLKNDAGALSGPLIISRLSSIDQTEAAAPNKIHHRAHLSAGGMNTQLIAQNTAMQILAQVKNDNGEERIAAIAQSLPSWNGGRIAWVRGSLNLDVLEKEREFTDPEKYVNSAAIMRDALASLGITIGSARQELSQKDFVLTAARKDRAIWFSGYMRDTTVDVNLELPLGAPLLIGCDTIVTGSQARYRFPRTWHRECRIMIQQEGKRIVKCSEMTSEDLRYKRRVQIDNLKNATVHFLPERGYENKTLFQINPVWPRVIGPYGKTIEQETFLGKVLTLKDITGTLLISW